jgi:hypothetical protein
MSFQGRSLDDLPLAAYSSGVAPDEDESLDPEVDPDLVAAPGPTQQDLAAALADSSAAAAAPPSKPARRARASLKLPSLRRAKGAALQQDAPFQPVAAVASAAASFQAVSPAAPAPAPSFGAAGPSFRAASSFQAAPAFEPVSRPPLGPKAAKTPAGAVRRGPRVNVGVPGLNVRDPRVLAGGVVVVGLAMLGISLLGGGGPTNGSTGPNGSQDPGAVAATPVPGSATVELTAALKGGYTLTGATGAGAAVGGQLNATWTDSLGDSLGLTGAASQGTRTTDATFLLTWTMRIGNQPVTFTSRGAECTVGMAVTPRNVHGTFVCKKLKSADGDHVIDLRGSYTT